ncbi:unnamed protein product [Ranitomeya imitator]|uniref:Uncharacterized protein n=1 Tax=Ranitomeya imitator TaxID=111125 RepID=A0ABN9KV67_9NEOB|nr:unnamed protein product [Ranitomeya imitator]
MLGLGSGGAAKSPKVPSFVSYLTPEEIDVKEKARTSSESRRCSALTRLQNSRTIVGENDITLGSAGTSLCAVYDDKKKVPILGRHTEETA